MDLPELLARAGIQPNAVADLMTWARARSSALLATLDASSPLGQRLAPGLAQLVMRADVVATEVPPAPPVSVSVPTPADDDDEPTRLISSPAGSRAPVDDDEVPVIRAPSPSRNSPRAVAREITRPYLGAAVEAALQTGESSGGSAPADSVAPPPASGYDEDESSIGGFTRLAFSVRRPQGASERPSETRAPLAHGFALHAEKAAAEASQFTGVPAPPSFEAGDSSARLRAFGVTGDSERSTSLVVGIPDDEGDVPLPRQRSRSAGLEATASGSLRAAAPVAVATTPSELSIELNLAIEDPELSSALFRMIPEGGETSSTLTRTIPQPAALAADATDSLQRPIVASSEMSLQIPITIEDASGFTPSPLAGAELESPAPSPTRPRKTPPPPPPARTSVIQAAPEPAPQPAKRARGKKKIVELGAPVARPTAKPTTPTPATSRPSREVVKSESSQAVVPNYLRDDDE